MVQYNVTGMSCAACSARVEKAVSKVEGVTSVSVSLLTNSMGVEGTADSSAVIQAVMDAGYGASVKAGSKNSQAAGTVDDSLLKDTETPKMVRRLVASAILWLPLMYLMGYMLWNWPIPTWFDQNHLGLMLFEMLDTILVMVINQKFFVSGFKGLIHRAPNMDTLVSMGATAAFCYSAVMLFLMSDAVVKGDHALAMTYMDEMYFESAATILTLITIGKTLEAYSKGRTTDALKSLMRLAPKTATLIRNGAEVEVGIDQVRQGDIFVVRPGESIPVDGVILDGHSAVNEAALTGESIPVDKEPGDPVSAATINQSGFIRCQATRVGEDTTLSQIIQMVSDAAATKAPIAKIADRVSGVFVPTVLGIAAVTFVIWMLVGQNVGYSLARAISVLVISCPCSLGLATPVAIMVGNGIGAKNGIMFKTAVSLEETGKVDIVALDKTGTITSGEPRVTNLIPMEGITETELLTLAYALEKKSEHPLARAILFRGQEDCVDESLEVDDFEAKAGNGLTGTLNGSRLSGGNLKFIREIAEVPNEVQAQADELAENGKTPLFFTRDHSLIGIIAVADVIKPDSAQAIQELRNMGIHVVMLTGDNERTARAIGREAGVDEVIAGVLPEGKEAVIRSLKEKGKVAMVGDGINDAPALTRADMGIAIGAGTDIAIDAADVVLMKSRLTDVSAAIRLSRATLRDIYQNLVWAFCYNCAGIPLAAGAFVYAFGWTLNPMFGAAAMSMSSVCVVCNALRLNFFKVRNTNRDKPRRSMKKSAAELSLQSTQTITVMNPVSEPDKKIDIKENSCDMTKKVIQITGMMCNHCERTVKGALETLDGVSSAEVSYEKGTAVVILDGEVSDEALKAAVESDEEYKVTGISLEGEKNEETTRIIQITGMMCSHCERTVKKALETLDGVASADVSYEKGTAVVILDGEVSDEALKAAVESDEEYKVTGISLEEEKTEETTRIIQITGMMCSHCERTVKEALESLDGVASAEVSHEKGTAVVILDGEVSNETLKAAVESDEDYKVTGFE